MENIFDNDELKLIEKHRNDIENLNYDKLLELANKTGQESISYIKIALVMAMLKSHTIDVFFQRRTWDIQIFVNGGEVPAVWELGDYNGWKEYVKGEFLEVGMYLPAEARDGIVKLMVFREVD